MQNYIFYSVAGLGFSYLIFLFILKREKNFHFIRFYLLGSLILCLLSPVLNIDWGLNFSTVRKIQIEKTFGLSENSETPEKETVAVIERDGFSSWDALPYLYFFIVMILLFRFVNNVLKIFNLINSHRKGSSCHMKIIEKDEKGNPFSFFNYLFVHPEDQKNKEYFNSVLSHELAHSKEFHSADVIFMELLSCFFWFNPFVWLYKQEIIENHEFLADAFVIRSGTDTDSYSFQLIRSGDRIKQPFISGFSFINTKNRLNMMYKTKSPKSLISLKVGLVLFLFSGVFAISSFSPAENSGPFVVVVDAGHGGKDAGPLNEKEVNLQVSKFLQAVSRKNEIEIILIREEDRFLNLEDRIDFVKAQKPDLLLSLHSNTSSDVNKKGVEAYYTPEGPFPERSLNYSKILVSKQVKDINDRGEIKTANFRILREVPVPAVLLELGFLSNKSEAAILRNPEMQKKIAEAIYDGLLEIKSGAGK